MEIDTTLQRLRDHLTRLDGELIRLVAERQRIVAQVGSHKIRNGAPTRDYEREREVLSNARTRAVELGIEPELAEAISTLLIRSSLTQQEETRIAASNVGSGRRALVIGGAGRMGSWFVRFLASQAYAVETADPAAQSTRQAGVADWRSIRLDHDVIIIAAPIKATGSIMIELADRKPAALIFDIGSLKGPLRAGLDALSESGCRVTSIHPMFGPDTRLLSGRHVIFVDVGHRAATEEARSLFERTMVQTIEMSLDQHDRIMAYVLGLAHVLNIAFLSALSESGELVPHLRAISSTTFDAQLEVASRVAGDNPNLYFEIQRLNEYGHLSLEALGAAVRRIQTLVHTGDEEAFAALMRAGQDYCARGNERHDAEAEAQRLLTVARHATDSHREANSVQRAALGR